MCPSSELLNATDLHMLSSLGLLASQALHGAPEQGGRKSFACSLMLLRLLRVGQDAFCAFLFPGLCCSPAVLRLGRGLRRRRCWLAALRNCLLVCGQRCHLLVCTAARHISCMVHQTCSQVGSPVPQ